MGFDDPPLYIFLPFFILTTKYIFSYSLSSCTKNFFSSFLVKFVFKIIFVFQLSRSVSSPFSDMRAWSTSSILTSTTEQQSSWPTRDSTTSTTGEHLNIKYQLIWHKLLFNFINKVNNLLLKDSFISLIKNPGGGGGSRTILVDGF